MREWHQYCGEHWTQAGTSGGHGANGADDFDGVVHVATRRMSWTVTISSNTQALRVLFDGATRKILRAIAEARPQLGRLLLAIENGQTVAAAARAAVAFEHAVAEAVIIVERRRAERVGHANVSRRCARDDGAFRGGFDHFGTADFDTLLVELTERRTVTITVHQHLAFVAGHERNERALTSWLADAGLAGNQVGAVDHFKAKRKESCK